MQPILTKLSHVTHVGSLNILDKGVRGPSQEGLGVSFSLHPEDWERIAKIGGQPWWSANLSGKKILDGHHFVKTYASELEAWGISQGYVTPCTAWRYTWYDDEIEDELSAMAASREEAEGEVDYMEEDQYTIEEVQGLAPTQKLVDAMALHASDKGKPSLSALQDLATVWARDQELAGVWWNDMYDPDALSAPRGVIFPEHVESVGFKLQKEVSPVSRPRKKMS